MRRLIKHFAYPAISGGMAVLLVVLASRGSNYWPLFPLLATIGVTAVALLERLAPFEAAWRHDQDGDIHADVLHFAVSHALIQSAVAIGFGLRELTGATAAWPMTAPMWVQVLLAGFIMDLGLYAMHRWSHVNGWLWRLHAIHHSPRRLYWLNGGRRHPLSALVLASPGLVVLLALGVAPIALGAWMSIMSIHLAFQHANLDYRLGPLRAWLGVAEMHRWHHRREFENAQVNFGEVFLVWDHLFGTWHDAAVAPSAVGAVGLSEDEVPRGYVAQLVWPFRHPT